MKLGFASASFGIVMLLALSVHAQLPDPILYYPFNNTGLPVGDFSGNGNGGNLMGSAALTGGGIGQTGSADDRALDLGAFNNGAFVDISSAARGAFDSVVANDSVTLSLWLFGNDQQPQSQWTFHADGPSSPRILGSHAPWGDGTVYFDVANCCGATQRISAAPASPDDFMGQWNHYAYVKDGTSTAVYINGSLLVDSGVNEIEPLSTISRFALGSTFGGGSSYGGMIDDFAVFDVALSPAQIAEITGGEAIPGISLLGDFDDSGAITGDDFQILAANLGAHLRRKVTHADGDIDLNGLVNLHDFRSFKAAFPGAFAAATGVPEPASVVLVLLAIGALLPLSRRRSKRA